MIAGWRSRSHRAHLFRYAISAALLIRAGTLINWREVSMALGAIAPGELWRAVALIALSNALAGWRWGGLMQRAGFNGRRTRFIGLFFAGGLINQALPTTLVGDGYRAFAAASAGRAVTRSAAPTSRLPLRGITEALAIFGTLRNPSSREREALLMVALDRSLGLMGNIALGTAGLALGGAMIAPWLATLGLWVLGLMLVCTLIVGALIARGRLNRALCAVGARLRLVQLDRRIGFAWGWPHNLRQLALSILVHILAVGALGACLSASGVVVPFTALLVGMPAAAILTLLPISVSGWGLRETTLVALLALWQIPAGPVVIGSILYGALSLLVYLPAAPMLLTRPREAATQSRVSSPVVGRP